MRRRVMFLSSLGQLGLSFSAQKLQAIVLGDHSNPTVPPVLIHVAQLMGCVLWRYKNESNKYSASEALQLHHVSQAMLQTREPWTLVEVHIVLAVYQFTQHQLYDARDYVEKAVHVVQQHNLHFPLVEPTDEVEEQLCALSQLLALDKTTSAVLNVPTLLDMEYEQRFATIPFFYPSISRNNLAILRARSALIMHQTRKLSAKYTAIFCSDRGLCDDYWALLHEATDHIANLHPLIMRASFQHDDEYCIGLKICLIIALTASAELYRIAPKSHSDSRQKCLDVLQEIMGMYRISDDTFFIIMEPILGICWMILANVVLEEERYALTKAASLYWSVVRGEIIGCVYRVVVLFPYMAPSIYMMKDIVQKSSKGITDERGRISGSAQVAEVYSS
ncbi:hypothetical protein A0H81_04384 [Grifola frondosa]|uniref:Uncharacterized protein n=1 Tax=Grifola frondosa TaxID=5627 RepID=A0A1C7MGG6_GRIFR|nr:hypothetical protein A0H81_04384 [Grifola frondosa]